MCHTMCTTRDFQRGKKGEKKQMKEEETEGEDRKHGRKEVIDDATG